MNTYKTLKVIDGQEYITVAEHEEIVKGVFDLRDAIDKVKTGIAGLSQATSGLSSLVTSKEK